jgi:hypothetical protein
MRVAAVRVAVLVLLAPCGALCQQPAALHPVSSLPDAPSSQAFAPSRALPLLNTGQAWFVTGALGFQKAAAQEFLRINRSCPVSLLSLEAYKEPTAGNSPGSYLYAKLLNRNLNYHPAASGSLMSRATAAASHTLITRAPDGKGRLNTSYFLGVLSSAVLHTAYRPYWNRPISAPFSDFGSTIGNDAGMNLLHEFGPSIQELMKNHTPKFVSKIEASIGHK